MITLIALLLLIIALPIIVALVPALIALAWLAFLLLAQAAINFGLPVLAFILYKYDMPTASACAALVSVLAWFAVWREFFPPRQETDAPKGADTSK